MLTVPQIAHAEDQCRDVLSHGMSDSSTSVRDKTSQQAEQAFYCSSNYNEARRYFDNKRSSAGDANAKGGYGPFSFGAGGSNSSSSEESEDNFNKWSATNCGNNSSSSFAHDYEYLAQSNVSETIVQEWGKCMSNRALKEGLICYASPQPDDVEITVLWLKQSTLHATVIGSTIRGGKSLFDNTPPGRLIPTGFILNPGTLVASIDRNEKQRVSASLNISHGGQNFACTIYVPQIDPPPPPATLPKLTNLARPLVSNARFGCTADPMSSKCQNDVTVVPSMGYAICRIDVSYVEGPTQYARWYNSKQDRSSVVVHVEADSDKVLFSGTHQWAYVRYAASEIGSGATSEERNGAGCNVN